MKIHSHQNSSHKMNWKHVVGFIFVGILGFVFITWFWIRTNTPGSQGGDADRYSRTAINLVETGKIDLSREGIALAPLYPTFLSLVYRISGGENFVAASIANFLLFAILVVILGIKAFRQFGPLIGYFTSLLIILNHKLLFWAPFALSEMLFTLFLVLSVIALHEYSINEKNLWLIIGGFFAGLAALTRGALLIYMPPLIIWLLVASPGSWRVRISKVVIFSAIVLSITTPWSYWASINRDHFVPIADNGIRNLYAGNYPVLVDNLRDFLFGSAQTWWDFSLPGLDDAQRIQAIRDFVLGNPLDWLKLYFLKLYYHLQFFNLKDIPSLRVAIWNTLYWVFIWVMIVIYILKVPNFWRNIFCWIIAANVFLHPLMHIARYTRYRLPVEPIFVLLSAFGTYLVLTNFHQRYTLIRKGSRQDS